MNPKPLSVSLVGSPNSGKSALFNALTGGRQKVGNYPGVTVEKKVGFLNGSAREAIQIIDLPGIYSLWPQSRDEEVSVKVLQEAAAAPSDHLFVAIADSTNLERSLTLILELKRLGCPMLVALNMIDLAQKRGLEIDLEALEAELDLPVLASVAIEKQGVQALEQQLREFLAHKLPEASALSVGPTLATSLVDLVERQKEARRIACRVIRRPLQLDAWSAQLDRVVLHPILGSVIFLGVMLVMFQAVFHLAETPMSWIETGVAWSATWVGQQLPHGLLRSLITEGVIIGVGSVLVFLPQILLLFFFIFLLEGSGYMPRAALMMNRWMRMMGLPGQSFVPLLSSFACAIPGMMAARTVKHPGDRLLTILVAPLMTCSARLPVYVLLIAAFIPPQSLGFGIELQGLVLFGLFVGGILSAMIVARLLRSTLIRQAISPLIVELPSYKRPRFAYIGQQLLQRTQIFLKRAGGLILLVSVVLWFLAHFPRGAGLDAPDLRESYAGRIGTFVEPVLAPLGFDWRISIGLVSGFAAREVIVSSLSTSFAIDQADEDDERQAGALLAELSQAWPLATALALLAWYVFSPQCISTFVVMRRETNSWGWPVFAFTYLLALAYGAAWLVHELAVLPWLH